MKSGSGNLRQALADRLMLSEAMDAVMKLVAAFPNGGADAGRGYLGALASILVTYPRIVALKCADPIQGVARETKFLPTVSDIVAWCERNTDDMKRPVEREDREARLLREVRERADADKKLSTDRSKRLTYEELQAKYGPNWGIDNGRQRVKTKAEYQQELIAQIGQAAFDALPDIGYDWTKLPAAAVIPEAPKTDWVEDEWPPGPPPPRAPL